MGRLNCYKIFTWKPAQSSFFVFLCNSGLETSLPPPVHPLFGLQITSTDTACKADWSRSFHCLPLLSRITHNLEWDSINLKIQFSLSLAFIWVYFSPAYGSGRFCLRTSLSGYESPNAMSWAAVKLLNNSCIQLTVWPFYHWVKLLQMRPSSQIVERSHRVVEKYRVFAVWLCSDGLIAHPRHSS